MGGGNPDSNTLLSDTTTVICLDDYHCLDRFGRKEKGVTALAPEAQDFDLMYNQVKDLKEGKTVGKPIYNHVSGLLDPAEEIESPEILIIEGLHPFYDQRVRDLLDFKIYLDAYIDPQKKDADVIIEVLPTQLLPGETEGNVLRVRLIQKEGNKLFDPAYLFDEGSTVSWIPCGRKLTCSFPGIKFFYGPDTYYGEEAPCWRWTGSSTSWRSSSTWRATSATPPASSTARSPSRCSSTPPSPGPPTARGSSRPSSA